MGICTKSTLFSGKKNTSLQNIKAFLQNTIAFRYIAHDGSFHLANQLEICVFSKNNTLTAKTQVGSTFLPKTSNDLTDHRNSSIRSDLGNQSRTDPSEPDCRIVQREMIPCLICEIMYICIISQIMQGIISVWTILQSGSDGSVRD